MDSLFSSAFLTAGFGVFTVIQGIERETGILSNASNVSLTVIIVLGMILTFACGKFQIIMFGGKIVEEVIDENYE